MSKFILPLAACLFLSSTPALAGDRHSEDWYNRLWCGLNDGAKAEVVLPDQSRADCVTADHVIETKFARDCKHGVGQALHYLVELRKTMPEIQGGVLLIIETPEDEKYYRACERLVSAVTPRLHLWTLRVK